MRFGYSRKQESSAVQGAVCDYRDYDLLHDLLPLFVHYNTAKAIMYDFFIQIKPFIAFYAAYSMGVRFNASQKLF